MGVSIGILMGSVIEKTDLRLSIPMGGLMAESIIVNLTKSNLGDKMEKWIHVYTDKVGLWTADLMDNNGVVENLGGSYPKSQSATYDAQCCWGKDLVIKIGREPEVDESKVFDFIFI